MYFLARFVLSLNSGELNMFYLKNCSSSSSLPRQDWLSIGSFMAEWKGLGGARCFVEDGITSFKIFAND
jgi:hypothetical protein